MAGIITSEGSQAILTVQVTLLVAALSHLLVTNRIVFDDEFPLSTLRVRVYLGDIMSWGVLRNAGVVSSQVSEQAFPNVTSAYVNPSTGVVDSIDADLTRIEPFNACLGKHLSVLLNERHRLSSPSMAYSHYAKPVKQDTRPEHISRTDHSSSHRAAREEPIGGRVRAKRWAQGWQSEGRKIVPSETERYSPQSGPCSMGRERRIKGPRSMPTVLHVYPDTDESKALVNDALARISVLRGGVPILCLYQNQQLPESRREGLNPRCVRQVRKIVENISPHKKIAVLLDSPGGDIECAYRVVSAIRRRVDYMEVMVADWAKSAATFFCLAAEKILLGPNGELGPLDPQLKSPRGSLWRTSALESFKALEYLRSYSLETLLTIVRLLTEELEMDVPYALEHAMAVISPIVTPLYQQVNPHELGQVRRDLSISEEYAQRVMTRWSYTDKSPKMIERIVRRLVWEYPTHGFVIDFEEAQELDLNVEEMEEETVKLCTKILEETDGVTGIWLPSIPDGTSIAEKTGIQEESHAQESSTPGQDGKDAPIRA